ncbi:MAG: imelysin family protein [Nannocystaceae bacterium]
MIDRRSETRAVTGIASPYPPDRAARPEDPRGPSSRRRWLAGRVGGLALVGVALGAALDLGCAPEEDLRGPVLRALADLGIAQSGELAAESGSLAGAVEALCAAPSAATQDEALARWSAAHGAWAQLAPLALGPEAEHAASIDFWPARVDTVEATVTAAAAASIDDAYVDGLGASAKGLPVLEYLLFGEGTDGGDPAAALAALTAPTTGAVRCAYAAALARDLEERSMAIADAWAGSFAETLASAGEGSTLYASRKEGIDAVVNQSIAALAVAVKAELDAPLGNLSGAPPDPALLRARFAGDAREALAAELRGVWAVYHGADPEASATGISVLVAAIDVDLDGRVRDQYAFTRAAVDALPEPQGSSLVGDRDPFQAARDELDALRRSIKLDVASALGVTLSLSDNDGD